MRGCWFHRGFYQDLEVWSLLRDEAGSPLSARPPLGNSPVSRRSARGPACCPRVAEVGGEAHVADRLLGLDGRAAVGLDSLERHVDVVDGQDDHRCMDRILPLQHPAADVPGLRGPVSPVGPVDKMLYCISGISLMSQSKTSR